jgi:hypothetical protein
MVDHAYGPGPYNYSYDVNTAWSTIPMDLVHIAIAMVDLAVFTVCCIFMVDPTVNTAWSTNIYLYVLINL